MNHDVNDDEGFPVMRGERRIRFVCGALAGAFAGWQFGSTIGAGEWGTRIVIVVTAIASGVAAAFLGDGFWRGLGRW